MPCSDSTPTASPRVVDVERETVASTIAVDVAEREGDDRSSDEEAPAELQQPAVDDQPQAGLPLAVAVGAADDDDLEDQDAHSEAISEDAGSRPADTRLGTYDSGAGAVPGTEGTRRPDRNHSSGGASAGMQRSGAAGNTSRMRSYVLVGDDTAYGATGDESRDALEIDRAGVDRVLAHESAHGREPRTLMIPAVLLRRGGTGHQVGEQVLRVGPGSAALRCTATSEPSRIRYRLSAAGPAAAAEGATVAARTARRAR